MKDISDNFFAACKLLLSNETRKTLTIRPTILQQPVMNQLMKYSLDRNTYGLYLDRVKSLALPQFYYSKRQDGESEHTLDLTQGRKLADVLPQNIVTVIVRVAGAKSVGKMLWGTLFCGRTTGTGRDLCVYFVNKAQFV